MRTSHSANGWSSKTLRDLATINYGRSPKEILAEGGPYPVVGTGGAERYGNGFLYDGESVVLGRKGTIERVYFATGRFWTIDTAYYLSDFDDTLPRWLYYVLQNMDLRQLNEATGVPSLSRDRLYQIQIAKPPRIEQAKIAEILSTVDRAIEQTEGLIAKQQRIKTGLMQDLLTRGIDEQGNLRSEETHQFKDSPLGRIPVEWEVETLGTALRRCKGFLQTGPFGSSLHAHEYVHEGIPVIMPQDIIRGEIDTTSIARITEEKANSLRRHRVQPNDIVFSRRGDLTRASAISPRATGWLCGTGCFLLRVPAEQMNSVWFAHLYRFHVIQRQVDANAVGSTMPSLNNGVMENLVVSFPGVVEQNEVVRRVAAIDSAMEIRLSHLHKLNVIKTALMQDLLTGEVRVTPLLEREPTALAAGPSRTTAASSETDETFTPSRGESNGGGEHPERPDASAFGSERPDASAFGSQTGSRGEI